MFELAERGYRTPFQQLVACIIQSDADEDKACSASRSSSGAPQTAAWLAALTVAHDRRLLIAPHLQPSARRADPAMA
jgi:hypothetical protein